MAYDLTDLTTVSQLKTAVEQIKDYHDSNSSGSSGSDGNGIKSMVQTTKSTTSSGANVWTATMDDGTTYTFTVYNGAKGDAGDNYTLTDTDKSEIASLVLAQITDGDEVSY